MNGGKCKGVNKCRCPSGLSGDHCEIGPRQKNICKKPCRHGICTEALVCECDQGWFGRFCNQSKNKNVS